MNEDMICELTQKHCNCPKCEHRVKKQIIEPTGLEVLGDIIYLTGALGILIGIIFWMC